MDTSNWIQYHPNLKDRWRDQLTAYKPNIIKSLPIVLHDEIQITIKPQNNHQIIKQSINPISIKTNTSIH